MAGCGLEGWQRGQSLEDALGLHDDDSDYCSMDLYERDDLIRAAIRLCPGDSESAQASFFLGVMHGHARHPDETGARFVDMLSCARVYIPKTVRHLRRIMAGRRQRWMALSGGTRAIVSLTCAAVQWRKIHQLHRNMNGKEIIFDDDMETSSDRRGAIRRRAGAGTAYASGRNETAASAAMCE